MRVDAEATLKHIWKKIRKAAAEWQEFQKLRNDVRITKFGNFIRRTSIDELPQLINVLKRRMSRSARARWCPASNNSTATISCITNPSARHHRPLAGQRPQQIAIQGTRRPRSLVRAQLELMDGYRYYLENGADVA